MRVKILFLVTILLSPGLSGCNQKTGSASKATNIVAVQTQKVKMQASTKRLQVSGNIEGNKTVRLGFMVAGKISFISVEEGRKVGEGELLAGLDPESYQIAKDIADANLSQAKDEYNRLSQMHKSNSISESDFSKITNTLKIARAQQRLQAKNLSETKLYSPISGVLLMKRNEVGEIIDKGMPVFVVSDINPVKVNASIPETELHDLHMGDEASVYVSSVDSSFRGKIIEISSLADADTRTFSVKIRLENPDLLIRPGMTAEVNINTGKTDHYIAVPAEAILHDYDNRSYVYLADTIKNKAFRRNISPGRIIGNDIEVVNGLNTGELLIISGHQKLSNGSSIIIK